MSWSGLALALALSVDGLVVGFFYGMRRIAMPWTSVALVGLCSAAGMTVSMVFGGAVTEALPARVAQRAGGGVLVLLGLWQLLQGWAEGVRARKDAHSQATGPDDAPPSGPFAGSEEKSAIEWQLRVLGVVVRILVDPEQADRDRSGRIESHEALALGLALGLDTLAAGFAAAMLQYGPFLVGAAAVSLVGLVWAGTVLGRRIGPRRLGPVGMFIPGALLVLLGLLHI